MANKKRLSNEDVQCIRDAYDQGDTTYREIAQRYNVTSDTIAKICRREIRIDGFSPLQLMQKEKRELKLKEDAAQSLENVLRMVKEGEEEEERRRDTPTVPLNKPEGGREKLEALARKLRGESHGQESGTAGSGEGTARYGEQAVDRGPVDPDEIGAVDGGEDETSIS